VDTPVGHALEVHPVASDNRPRTSRKADCPQIDDHRLSVDIHDNQVMALVSGTKKSQARPVEVGKDACRPQPLALCLVVHHNLGI